jgi:nitrogen fixation protein FixH
MKLNWGTGIAIFYVVFAAATTGFVVFAMDQKVDLVSEDYYQQALEHDGRMEAVANAASLGGAFRLELRDHAHTLRLTWAAARPDSGNGTIKLYRPSDSAADRSFPIDVDAVGQQDVALEAVSAGHWIVQVQWRSNGRTYYVQQSVIVP